MSRLSFFIAAILLFTGCFRREFKQPIAKGYSLYAYACHEDMTIMYFDKYGGFEIVGPTVFAMGYDKNFIIAKQHPAIYPEKENRSVTNYFIIPLNKPVGWTSQDVVMGPFNETQFMQMRTKLKIADTLDFSVIFHDTK